jgi:hypothetical protein
MERVNQHHPELPVSVCPARVEGSSNRSDFFSPRSRIDAGTTERLDSDSRHARLDRPLPWDGDRPWNLVQHDGST